MIFFYCATINENESEHHASEIVILFYHQDMITNSDQKINERCLKYCIQRFMYICVCVVAAYVLDDDYRWNAEFLKSVYLDAVIFPVIIILLWDNNCISPRSSQGCQLFSPLLSSGLNEDFKKSFLSFFSPD